jgi:hypothetical protein
MTRSLLLKGIGILAQDRVGDGVDGRCAWLLDGRGVSVTLVSVVLQLPLRLPWLQLRLLLHEPGLPTL